MKRGDYLEQDTTHSYQKWIGIIFLLVIGILSFLLANSAWVQQINTATLADLDQKKETVVALTVLAGSTSTAITLIPGDVGGPIAQNIADIADYLLIVFAAIWLQKYLLSVTGLVAFKLLIPIACSVGIGYILFQSNYLKRTAMRIALMGVLLFTVIPMSVGISNRIEDVYESSIQQTIEQAESVKEEAKQDQSLLGQLTSAATDLTDKFQKSLSNMIDATAVLIITTCVGPIVVFLFSMWASKLIMGLNYDVNLPRLAVFNRKK